MIMLFFVYVFLFTVPVLIYRESMIDENDLLYVVSGAGHVCCTDETHLADVPSSYLKWYVAKHSPQRILGGFSSLKVDAVGMSMRFYDQDGTALYDTPVFSKRTLS
jgi:hypothetical protein